MKKQGIMPVRRSIRTRLLLLLLGLTLVSVVTIAFLAVNSILTAGESAQQASSTTLRAQAEDYLIGLTVSTAGQNDLRLEQVRQDVKSVAHFAAGVFEHPEAFDRGQYWRAQDHMFLGSEGQYINGEEDTSTVYVPNSVTIDDHFIADLELAAYMDLEFVPIYDKDPQTVAIYIIGKREFSRLYPNIDLGSILPADFVATQDIFFTSGTPENDPQREAVWTPVYDDPAGQGLLVSAVAPIYANAEFLGIIGIDVSLVELSTRIEGSSPVAGGYLFLVNDQRRAIALPPQGYQDILNRAPESNESGADLSAARPEFVPVLTQMAAGATGFESVNVNGRELFVAYAPMESTGWSLGTVVEADNMLQAVAVLQEQVTGSTQSLVLNRILPAGIVIVILAVVVGLWLTNRLVNPIQRLAMAAERIGAGEWDTPLPPMGRDEIGILARAFKTMAAQVRDLVAGLERRVAERTRDLERRAVQLATAAEVGRAAASILQMDTLVRQLVELVRDRFDLYYVGLFLLDSAGEYAVLEAGTGDPGRIMKEGGHKLQVGGRSMVGAACAQHQARIALDVGAEAVRFENPLLPETRSEMALPLMVGDRILGALDVQSTKPTAFSEEDIAVLQLMADQVAVAVDNARKFSEEATLVEATNPLFRASRHLAAATTSGEVAQAIIDSVSETEADLCAVAEYGISRKGEVTTITFLAGWERRGPSQFPIGEPLPASEPMFPLPLMMQPLVIEDMRLDARVPERTRHIMARTGSLALANVSLRMGDRLLGFVLIGRATAGPWSPVALRLYETLADQAAAALERARLLEETQFRAEQERLVREITDKMRSAPDMDSLMRTAVQEVAAALGTNNAFLRLAAPLQPAGTGSHNGDEEKER
jgi:GAF domain-containing protein/HAMP domain-containing protein